MTVEVTYADVVSAGCAADDGLPEGNATLERTFTITATDCEGNVTVESTTQIANFFDIEAPSVALACPADTMLSADADCGVDMDPALLGMPAVTAADDCDSVAWTVAHEDVEVAGLAPGGSSNGRSPSLPSTIAAMRPRPNACSPFKSWMTLPPLCS